MQSPSLFSGLGNWNALYDYVVIYGPHLILGVLLSAMTIFRREMSCNRVFHQEDESIISTPEDSQFSDSMEEETEELLDSAGSFCSCQSIVHLASMWMDSIPDMDQIEPAMKMLKEDVTPTELLDRAGSFCSIELIVAAMGMILPESEKGETSLVPSQKQYDPFTNILPVDVHVHIASFLHPKDVVSLSGVSRSYHEVVNESSTSNAIWRTLFDRDYKWVLENWQVGRDAQSRSGNPEFLVDKDFYFRFGESYLNYILAGRNTSNDCWVGLHCHIYNISNFIERHPGSPDTLMAYSGKDSTQFFEDMGHSLVARRLAGKFCDLVDLSQLSEDGWGLRPTYSTILLESDNVLKVPPRFANTGEHLHHGRRQRAQGGTLYRVREGLKREQAIMEQRLERIMDSNRSILGNAHLYYDPLLKEWRVWYTNSNLEPVFDSI